MFAKLPTLLRQNRSFYTAYLLFLLIGSVWLALVGKEPLFLQMNQWHHPITDALFPWLTHLGDGLFAVFFLLIFALRSYRIALKAFWAFLAVLFFTQLGKLVIFDDALRPFAYFEAQGVLIRTIEGVKVHAHNSFPSGHSASAFALFSFIALHTKSKSLGIFWFAAALVVAYTRVYIAQHFFGDVLAGSMVGVVLVLLISAGLDQYFDRKPAHWHQKGLLSSF